MQRGLSLTLAWLILVGTQAGMLASTWAQWSDEPLDRLIGLLQDSNVVQRRDAIYEIVRRRTFEPRVIESFEAALGDKDQQVQFQALLGLAHAGPDALPALETLLDRMDDRNDQIKFRAADAVGKIGVAALPAVLARLEEGGRRFPEAAAQAIGTMGPDAESARPALERLLQESSENVAVKAAAALLQVVPNDPELMWRLTQHSVLNVRLAGISGLAALPRKDRDVTEQLLSLVRDSDPAVRAVAVVVSAKLELDSATKSAAIEAGLVDSADSVRSAAQVALRQADLDGRQFAERLMGRLAEADIQTAESLLSALAAVGPGGLVALPSILEVVERHGMRAEVAVQPTSDSGLDEASDDQQATAEDGEEAVAEPAEGPIGLRRSVVVAALAGPGAAAVPALLSAVESRPDLEQPVALALARIGQPALDAILVGTRDDQAAVKIASVRALGSLQPLPEPGLARLVEVSNDALPEVRVAAVKALQLVAATNQAAREAVWNALGDSDPRVRAMSAASLGNPGFTREQRRDGFRRGLQDPEGIVKAATLRALQTLPGQVLRQAEEVLALTSAPESDVRVAAFQALSSMGSEPVKEGKAGAPESIERVLQAGLQDQELSVKLTCIQAVRSLKVQAPSLLPMMIENLSGPRELVVATLETLPEFGERGADAAPAVTDLLNSPWVEVRIAAVTSIGRLERDALRLTQALMPMLNDREWVVRRVAGRRLGEQGSVAVSSVPKLFELLGRHEDKDYAGEALRRIDTAPPEMVSVLIEHLDSKDRRKAFYAVSLLSKMGENAVPAIPIMESILKADRQGGEALDDFRRNHLKQALETLKGGVTTGTAPE